MGALLLLKLCGPIWTYESLWYVSTKELPIGSEVLAC